MPSPTRGWFDMEQMVASTLSERYAVVKNSVNHFVEKAYKNGQSVEIKHPTKAYLVACGEEKKGPGKFPGPFSGEYRHQNSNNAGCSSSRCASASSFSCLRSALSFSCLALTLW